MRIGAMLLAAALAGCYTKTIHPLKESARRAEVRRPESPPNETVRIRLPVLDECCAPTLLEELAAVEGIRSVRLGPDGAELVIDRDPAIAPDSDILEWLQTRWKHKAEVLDEK